MTATALKNKRWYAVIKTMSKSQKFILSSNYWRCRKWHKIKQMISYIVIIDNRSCRSYNCIRMSRYFCQNNFMLVDSLINTFVCVWWNPAAEIWNMALLDYLHYLFYMTKCTENSFFCVSAAHLTYSMNSKENNRSCTQSLSVFISYLTDKSWSFVGIT